MLDQHLVGSSASVRAARVRFLALFNSNDSEAVADCFSQQSWFLPPGLPAIMGRQAIRAYWQGVFDTGRYAMEYHLVEMEGEGRRVYEFGVYLLRRHGGSVLDQGNYLVIWMQSDDEWYRHWELWNSVSV